MNHGSALNCKQFRVEHSFGPLRQLLYLYDCAMILLSGLSLPMLLSGFSHMETWHLACNMIVLWSFSPVIHGTVSGFFYVSSIISIDLKTKTLLGW